MPPMSKVDLFAAIRRDSRAGLIRYDNLRAAVAQVLGFTRQRVETTRWTAFRSHFSVDPFYCQLGLQGAHEKGGVEGQIGWFRRNHLVPDRGGGLRAAQRHGRRVGRRR